MSSIQSIEFITTVLWMKLYFLKPTGDACTSMEGQVFYILQTTMSLIKGVKLDWDLFVKERGYWSWTRYEGSTYIRSTPQLIDDRRLQETFSATELPWSSLWLQASRKLFNGVKLSWWREETHIRYMPQLIDERRDIGKESPRNVAKPLWRSLMSWIQIYHDEGRNWTLNPRNG